MARIPQVYRLFSSQSVTSAGTITSTSLAFGREAYASLHYVLASATTGLYVAGTIQLLVAADPREPFVLPVNTAGGVTGYLGYVNSNNRYISTAFPLVPWAQVQIKSVTNNTLTFDAVYLVLDEQN